MSAVYYQPGRRRQRLPIQILRVGIMVTILRCGKAFSLLSKRAATTSRRPPSVCPSFNRRCTSTNRRTSSSLAAEKRRRRDSLDTAASAASSTEQSASSVLSWEKFEFSDSPKWDHRFEANLEICIGDTETSKEEALSKLYEQEAIQDAVYAKQTTQQKAAWQRLDPDTVRRSTDIVRPYINEERIHKIQTVLKQRTGNTRFLFENPSNPSNVWACLRTIEAFGIQHVDVVIQSGTYQGKAALSQKRGMRTAMGSAQWLTLTNHPTTAQAVRNIQQEQPRRPCRIYASDLHPDAVDIRSIDWQAHSDQPICIVMGNEDSGISEEMRQLADVTFTLPMVGFAESFNLSVATAITLAHLSAASNNSVHGPLRPGDLSEHEQTCLFLKGLLHSLPQKRMARALLRQAGIDLHQEFNLL